MTAAELLDPPLARTPGDIHDYLKTVVEHLAHMLPDQAPIKNFVHHNTIHGFQHLPFNDALAEAERITGIRAYWPESEFRRNYRKGRITEHDLKAALTRQKQLHCDEILLRLADRTITRQDVILPALIHGIEAVTADRLVWLIQECQITESFQDDVPEPMRSLLLGNAEDTAIKDGHSHNAAIKTAIQNLWHRCIACFDLSEADQYSATSAEPLCAELLNHNDGKPSINSAAEEAARKLLAQLLDGVGEGYTLGNLLRSLTGQDLLDQVRPQLVRFSTAFLDEGLAAWPLPEREQGFYHGFKSLPAENPVRIDSYVFDFIEYFRNLPATAVAAVAAELNALGLPQASWPGYLRNLALENPGCSGMFQWRMNHPKYAANRDAPAHLMDYLAVRLILDRYGIESICQETWGARGTLGDLRRYLERRPAEAYVRHALYCAQLPEHLSDEARRLTESPTRSATSAWCELAVRVWNWRQRSLSSNTGGHSIHGSAWRLFRLAQHLGLSSTDIGHASREQIAQMMETLDGLNPNLRGAIWLDAYEHHYREDLLNGLGNNRGLGRWKTRAQRPQSQVVFCIDDREEGFRRHLEDLSPQHETLGAAGFFGVVMNWRGIDDKDVTPLCPVVAVPSHEVTEQACEPQAPQTSLHATRREHWLRIRATYQELRRNLVSTALLIWAYGPAALAKLFGRLWFPTQYLNAATKLETRFVPPIMTQLLLTATENTPATPEQPRLGFTDNEQADRVAALLRNIGLTSGFAPLVILMGHGSRSENNPHIAAYDCGACSGRHGGPNARAFATMANRPEIRSLLRERNIGVPADTWFIGAEHNTCDEMISMYDLARLPPELEPALARLRADLDQACQLSAHERCRRFASAPDDPSLDHALRHVIARADDFSQARPELGHATNAAAIVGRRSLSQGLFLDRRAFLISYDPTIDPTGTILEGILAAVGPVGAGINLEYYFSTVNSERFGCGSKIPHNVTGLFAVMEGAISDLRTGLPRQMTEIHEPVRLQIVVEAKCEILTAIYHRQAELRELIGNAWVHVIAVDPDTGEFALFEPGQGFVPWRSPIRPISVCARSTDWYRGNREPLPPALIGHTPSVQHA